VSAQFLDFSCGELTCLEIIDSPKDNNAASGDPYKTLFISRLSYQATEADLRKEFEMYGPIEKLRIVRDKKTGKSKGYAFVLYEREKDMKGKVFASFFVATRTHRRA
jgi:U1 small nuclear ribonucleoprotein 70kDa